MKKSLLKTTRLGLLVVFTLTHCLLLAQTNRTNSPKNESSVQGLAQSNSNGNEKINSSQTENQSPFDAVKGKREDKSKRDAFSKHYINDDGSFTALIGAGPIHFEKNGQFLDIDHNITSNFDSNFPYANTTNLFESYFGATSHTGVKNKTAEGEIQEFLNTKMYWEVNGQAVNTLNSTNKAVRIDGDKAYYDNIYGNISAEFITQTGKRKLNYIIPNQQALGNIPSGADFLVFTEDVILPFGWTSSITESGVVIKDQLGKEIYLYENPVSTDAANELRQEENTIFETLQLGNTLTIKTKVKTAWLLSSERVFPVMVDPMVNATANGGKSVYNDGYEETLGIFGRVAGYWLQYHIKFDTSSIPSGSTINSVIGYRYQSASYGTRHASSTWAWTDSADPTTTSGTALYNSPTALYSTSTATNNTNNSWKSSAFTVAGRTYVSNSINNLGYLAATVYPSGTWNNGQYYANNTHSSASNKPYLLIDYTAPAGPPSCATNPTPANGSTGAAHQGDLKWNAAAGATSYDVYFGTVASPPLVSTNQAGTAYTITDCLLPDTTYYWRVVPKNADGSATGCTTWSFTTDEKLNLYYNDWEIEDVGVFNTTGGVDTDGWLTNNNSATGGVWSSGYNNTWTVGDGTHAISGKSVGVSALFNGGLAGNFFQYWSDLGEIHRWIYRPFDMRGLRDIEVTFRWKAGGEANQDYGSVISSINGGANWLMHDQGGLYNDGRYWNSPTTIRSQSITFPETRNNQQNFVLGFKWDDMSGNGYSIDPTFVVDDIVVKACPYEGEILSDEVGSGIYEWIPAGSTETTLTIDGSHPCAQFEWEQSIDEGVTWTVITGANSDSYTTPNDLTVSTWYRSRVYFGTGCPGAYQEEPFKVIIEDCANSTTWNGTTWSNGIPNDSTTKIIFDGNYTSTNSNTDSGNLTGCSLEVISGNVVISSGHSVTLDKEIKVSGGSFTLENEASLVQIQADAMNTGNITVKRNTTEMVKFDATYWSSPVSGQNLKGFSSATLNNRFYIYNGYNAAPEGISPHFKAVFVNDANYPMPPSIPGDWNVPTDELIGNLFRMDTYTFKPGWGYSIRVPNNWPHPLGTAGEILAEEFTGEPHNGDISVPAYGKYTMVGNPYPSPIQTMGESGFFTANANVGTLHFWTHHFDVTQLPEYNFNYVTFTRIGDAGVHPGGTEESIPNGIIAVGQGFVVENSTIPQEQSPNKWDVVFTNEMRTTDQGIFIKPFDEEIEKHRFWLSVSDINERKLAQILVGYMTDATYEFDHQIDGRRLGTAPLFSRIGEEAFTVQGRTLPFEIEDVVKLGFTAHIEGKFKIGLDNFDGFFSDEIIRIYVRDHLNQIEHDLMSADYWFESEEGEFPTRFEIIYKTEEVLANEELDKNQVIIYHNPNNIVIQSQKEKILEVELWDLSGKKLHQNKKVNANSYEIKRTHFGTQVLLVKVLTANGEITSKKIINY